MKTYKTREYNEISEGSEVVGTFDTLKEAKKCMNKIGINGEVWEVTEDEETCIFFNRKQQG